MRTARDYLNATLTLTNILLSIMAPAQDVDSEHQQTILNSCVMAIYS